MAAALGNKYAKNRIRIVGDTLRRVAKQNPKRLRAACEAMLAKAESGDVSAFREFADRLDGKVPQALTGPDGGAVIHTVERVIVEK